MEDIPQYVLKKNHNTSFPRRVLYLDTEAKEKIVGTEKWLRTKLAWLCYVQYSQDLDIQYEKWTMLHEPLSICNCIRQYCYDKTPLWIFGHNIYYDLQSTDFFYYFSRWGWKLGFVHDSGLTFILAIQKDKKAIKCISTTNYYDFSLKELGEMIGMEKGEVDFNACTDSELELYCRRDVEILKKVTENYMHFVKDNDLGMFSMTKASQSFNAYRHRFMKKKIHIHKHETIKKLERKAYFGGRTECFRFGPQSVQDYITLDINSMYPYIMKYCRLPLRCIDYHTNSDLKLLSSALQKYGVIADVEIETEEPVYAYREDIKVLFPVGKFRTFLCTPGLQYGLEHGHIRKIYESAIYEMDYLFDDYVDFFFGLKLEAEKNNNYINRRLAKIMMNSLYGKFGQRRPIEEKHYDPQHNGYYRIETLDTVSHENFIEYQLFHTTVQQYGFEDTKDAFVALPAHITEYGRMLLWKIITQVGIENVYYCDTDSVKIRKCDFDRIIYPIHPTELGSLAIEDEFRHFEIWGCKHYVCDDKKKIKGVPRTAEEVEPFVYHYYQFERLATHMTKKIRRYYLLSDMKKIVQPQYDKGKVWGDGTISPFRLSPSHPLS